VLQANTTYGEHDDDLLANEWDAAELHEWGYDLPDWEPITPEDAEKEEEKPVFLRVEGEQVLLLSLVDELTAKGLKVSVK
jgi:hypothetical protein